MHALSMGPSSQLHAMLKTGELPLGNVFPVNPKPESSGLKVEGNRTFQVNIPSFDAPISTNKAFIFKLTIEDYPAHYCRLIGFKFLLLT